ncbi:MAG TPA: HipA domain-containing protein [Trebonia sp.]
MMTFTVAIGNTDAHLRNHSFLHATDTLTLAPIYDAIYDAAPTAEFAGTRQLALWINDQALLAAVSRDHLLREMTTWGLGSDDAVNIIDTTLTRLADAYDEAARQVPQVRPEIVAACKARTENLRGT